MVELFEENYEEEDTQRGRYLTFSLDANVYGIPIRFVTEIIGIQAITKVPETPDYVKGIINLRGKIIPLIDMRLKFGKAELAYNARTCVVVVNVNTMSVGLIVDSVNDILTINDDQIARIPENRMCFENRYIEGIVGTDDKAQLLLNVEKLLENDETDMIEDISEREPARSIKKDATQ
jgi:purine-binding chemotaxis protein CheW